MSKNKPEVFIRVSNSSVQLCIYRQSAVFLATDAERLMHNLYTLMQTVFPDSVQSLAVDVFLSQEYAVLYSLESQSESIFLDGNPTKVLRLLASTVFDIRTALECKNRNPDCTPIVLINWLLGESHTLRD